jgi:hypothetical protein
VKTFGIALTFAAGAIAGRWLLRIVPPRYAVDLAQPLVVATDWKRYGALFWLVLAIAIAIAFVPYLAQLRAPLSLRCTLGASALALAAGFFWLPLMSSDVYAYAAYGQMARLGLDPYVYHPSLNDAIVSAANWQWRPVQVPVCVYGPAFVLLARAIVSVLHDAGIAAVLDGFRLLSCAALLLCGYLASVIGGVRAAAFIACNPIALFAAIEGHNDTLMLAIVLAGVALMRRTPAIGAALTAAAAAIKLPAAAASAGIALNAILARRDAVAVVLGSAAALALVLSGSRGLIHAARLQVAPHGHYAPLASVQALGLPAAALALVAVLFRLRRAQFTIDRWCTIALAAWIAIPNPYPWYALWLLPLGAFARDRRIATTVLTVTAATLLRYLPDAAALPSPLLSLGYGTIALSAYAPLVL